MIKLLAHICILVFFYETIESYGQPGNQRNICKYLDADPYVISEKKCMNLKAGASCTFTCKDGFRPKGSNVRTCARGGIWMQGYAECEEIICSIPPWVDKANVDSCKNVKAKGTCTFTCETGFRPKRGGIRTCDETGYWKEGPVECEEIICSIPPWVDKANVDSCKNVKAKATCAFTCETGFRPKRGGIRTCDENGYWKEGPVECEEMKTCLDLKEPYNGELKGECWNAIPGSKCSFYCYPGHILKGSVSLHCMQDGQWDSYPPDCEEDKTCSTAKTAQCSDGRGRCEKTAGVEACICSWSLIWDDVQNKCAEDKTCSGAKTAECSKGQGRCEKTAGVDSCICNWDQIWDDTKKKCIEDKTCSAAKTVECSNGQGRCEKTAGVESCICNWDLIWDNTLYKCIEDKACSGAKTAECSDGRVRCEKTAGVESCTCNWNQIWDNVQRMCVEDKRCSAAKTVECSNGQGRCEKTAGVESCICNWNLIWDSVQGMCIGVTCNDVKESSSETWHSYCNRLENSVCLDSAAGGSPRCICKRGCRMDPSSDKCICSKNLGFLLRGNFSFKIEWQIQSLGGPVGNHSSNVIVN